MSEHTPTPWYVEPDECGCRTIGTGKECDVCHTVGLADDEEDAANANFIVRAVNSHVALLAACKELVGVIGAHEIESLSCDRDGEKYCECLRNAAKKAYNAAIALAEEPTDA